MQQWFEAFHLKGAPQSTPPAARRASWAPAAAASMRQPPGALQMRPFLLPPRQLRVTLHPLPPLLPLLLLVVLLCPQRPPQCQASAWLQRCCLRKQQVVLLVVVALLMWLLPAARQWPRAGAALHRRSRTGSQGVPMGDDAT